MPVSKVANSLSLVMIPEIDSSVLVCSQRLYELEWTKLECTNLHQNVEDFDRSLKRCRLVVVPWGKIGADWFPSNNYVIPEKRVNKATPTMHQEWDK